MKTHIIATIGPASIDFDIFNSLLIEGVTYIRINTAYGNPNQYDQILDNLIKSARTDVNVIFDIKNLDYIDYIRQNGKIHIAHSFTETAPQLQEVRKLLPNAFVISKIETARGVENVEEILDASDGTMIARGDLGEAVTLEKIPCLQKKFTKKGLQKGKFVIAATEMLLSMTAKPKPTRAEVSDVANAVFDGAHAVMLSEETAIGNYPIESVSYMRKIIEDAEKCDLLF